MYPYLFKIFKNYDHHKTGSFETYEGKGRLL